MRLSTPIWTTFFSSRRYQLGISFFKSRNLRAYTRHGSIAPVAYLASMSTTTTTSSSSKSTPNFEHPSIDDLAKKLDSLAPRFELQSGEITVLTTPEEFYSTLRKKILSAKKRIFLSSLYIGKEETELVHAPMLRN